MVAPFLSTTHFRVVLANEFFTPARLKEMREEIHRDGFVADEWLAAKPDSAVFGVNLACLYPFPAEVRHLYDKFSERLTAIDPGVYVYPHWETHITIATFINFTKEHSISQRVDDLIQRIASHVEPIVTDGSLKPFDLHIEHPVISRKAAILPLSDPSDAISKIRTRLKENLSRDQSLQNALVDLGLNIPPLVHSTIMRFKKIPSKTDGFLSRFDEAAREMPNAVMRVNEIYITTETKPYMRAGEIVRRFRL